MDLAILSRIKAPLLLREAVADVDAHTKRSKLGKTFNVTRHDRKTKDGKPDSATKQTSAETDPATTIETGKVNLNQQELKSRQENIDVISAVAREWLDNNVPNNDPTSRQLAELSKFIGEKYGDYVNAITDLYADRSKYENRPSVYVPVKNGPDIYLLGWRDTIKDIEGTEIHDHASSRAGVYVHKGTVVERLFGVPKNEFGKDNVPFKAIDRELAQGGTIRVQAPYVHEVYDKSDKSTAVTIHSYYPPLKEMSFYKVQGKRLVKTGHWKYEEGMKEHVHIHSRLCGFIEATTQVDAHIKRSSKGTAFRVRQHDREITKAAADMKIIGANEHEDKFIRELLSRHDPKVVKAVPYVAVLDRKDFKKAIRNSNYVSDGTEVGWYDEDKAFIVLNRSEMTGPSDWREVLDHELGHAAYYHSPKLREWNKRAADPKFDRFTWYAKQEDHHEAFAESYMAYKASNGKASNAKYKDVFSVIRKVLRSVNPKVNQMTIGPQRPKR